MKKSIILISISTLCLIGYSFFRGPDKSSPIQDILMVGTSADYPPYSRINLDTNEIVGFDIDIIREVARRLNKKIKIKDMPFNYLLFDLHFEHIDVVAAGLTPSEEKKKSISFSKPYLSGDPLIVITNKENDPITDISDLYGKTVAVNTGYTSDIHLSQIPQIKLKHLKATADAIMALQAKSVDAFATSQSNLDLLLGTKKEDHGYQFFTLPVEADSYSLAYSKNNTKLLQQIDSILDTMQDDGTLHKFKEKWGFA